ncbi:MAG: hypothetical protein IT443_10930 [Phycisphaeraceae bacterium]|nr:hypothetical protein [Phycisphaeraceae bacterium]
MLRVALTQARPGMVLALPIYHPQARQLNLLKVGYALEAINIRRLESLGLTSVWVRYPQLDFLSRYVSPQVAKSQAKLIDQISSGLQSAQPDAIAKLPYDRYCKVIGELVSDLMNNPAAAIFLEDLIGSGDALTRHSPNVAYLSILMGLKLETYLIRQRPHIDPVRATAISNLGVGAMLLDIGVTQLDPAVRQRYLETGDESDPSWQDHPRLGYELVHGQIEPSAAAVVLHHHQRTDGSGYAGRDVPILNGGRIHVFARIAGVAEQFTRFRNPPNLPPQPTVWALQTFLHDPLIRKFDLHVLQALIRVVPPYPPGTILRLNDGRWAVAVDHHPAYPCRPTVQIIEDPRRFSADCVLPDQAPMINLSEHGPSLYVAECDGRDVGDFNFTLPDRLRIFLSRAA